MTEGISTELVSSSTQDASLTITLKQPTRRYFDELLRLKCGPDLLAGRLFPNSKEVTESFGAFRAVQKHMGAQAFGDAGIMLVDVGCGGTPRTAAVFAYRTRWHCVAIDPKLNVERTYGINRLYCVRGRVPETKWTHPGTVVVTAVHCHARLADIVASIHAPRLVIVAIPCCVPMKLDGVEPVGDYMDWGIHSPHRRVLVYDIEEEA